MRTVITKELAVIENQLRAVKRHVRLVGENLSFEIEIKQFNSEPRILVHCRECVFAKINEFSPVECDDLKNIRSTSIVCGKGQNIWEELKCAQFTPA